MNVCMQVEICMKFNRDLSLFFKYHNYANIILSILCIFLYTKIQNTLSIQNTLETILINLCPIFLYMKNCIPFIAIFLYTTKNCNTKHTFNMQVHVYISGRKSGSTLFELINVPRSQFCRGSVSVQKREMLAPTICLQSSPNCIAIFPRLERGEFQPARFPLSIHIAYSPRNQAVDDYGE